MNISHIHKEKYGALLFLTFSMAYGALALNIELPFFMEEDPFTSRTMPEALAILGVIASLLMILLPTAGKQEKDRLSNAFRGLNWKDVILLLGLMVFYGLTIKTIGFIISTILFLAAGFWVLGERRIKVILLGSIPLVVIFWYVLSQLLGIYIDPGFMFYS